jgi:hypothetical protein
LRSSTSISTTSAARHFFADCCGFDTHQTAAVINDRVGEVGATRPVAGPLWEAAHAMGTSWGLQPRVFAWLFDLMRERGVTFPS